MPVEQVKIIGDAEDSMGGGKAGQAIGQGYGNAQDLFSQQAYQQGQKAINLQLDALAQGGMQALMGTGAQTFSGGSEIRSPFMYGTTAQRAYDVTTDTFVETMQDGTRYHYTGSGDCLAVVPPGMFFQRDSVYGMPMVVPVDPNSGTRMKPEPESSPHDAILKPSRKLKFAAE
jgi:hypothetical protein